MARNISKRLPKNILVDLNVILDVLLERPGFSASRTVLELQETIGHDVFISAHIVTTFAYLLENAKVPKFKINQHIDWLTHKFYVVSTTEDILHKAIKSQVRDYEDAVVEQAAIECRAEIIVTRNIKDFKNSAVPAIIPEELI